MGRMEGDGYYSAVDPTVAGLGHCSAQYLPMTEVNPLEGPERSHCRKARELVSAEVLDLHRTTQAIGYLTAPTPSLLAPSVSVALQPLTIGLRRTGSHTGTDPSGN